MRLRRGDGGECAAGLPWRLEIAEMRRVKAAKGSRRPEAHEPGKGPKEQNSTFPLEGTHSTNQPAKARTVSTDSNGNAAHQIARHVTAVLCPPCLGQGLLPVWELDAVLGLSRGRGARFPGEATEGSQCGPPVDPINMGATP